MAHPGTAHRYTEKLIAFEHAGTSAHGSEKEQDKDTLIWIGGLGDGLVTVRYVCAFLHFLGGLLCCGS